MYVIGFVTKHDVVVSETDVHEIGCVETTRMLIGSQVFAGESFWSQFPYAASPVSFSGRANVVGLACSGDRQRPLTCWTPASAGGTRSSWPGPVARPVVVPIGEPSTTRNWLETVRFRPNQCGAPTAMISSPGLIESSLCNTLSQKRPDYARFDFPLLLRSVVRGIVLVCHAKHDVRRVRSA